MKNQPVQSINTMLKETSHPENKVVIGNRIPDTGGSLDTGQASTAAAESTTQATEPTNEINSMGYNFNLSNRLMLDNDMDDIDSTDDMDDMDDLDEKPSGRHHMSNQSMGDSNYSNLTGLANNAAMFIEDDKRKRRAIANSNERRRMQSINAGFQTLKSLIPHSSGEKLSKACILQRSADFMQFLSNEKDKLSTKLTSALKLLESNGLMDQLNEKSSSEMRTVTTSSSFTSSSSKPSATTKINKQYVSAYNSTPAVSTPTNTSTSLLSSALADCTNDLKTTQQYQCPQETSSQENKQKQSKSNSTNTSSTTFTATSTVMPIKSVTTTIAYTQLQPTCITPDSDSAKKSNESSHNNSTIITPIQLATPIQCTNPTEINLLLNSGLTRLISANINTESSTLTPLSSDSFLEAAPSSDIPNLLLPSIGSEVVSPPLNIQCIQIDSSENTKNNSSEKSGKSKVTTNDLVALLNSIKDLNPNIDISSVTNIILKSIMSSKLDNILLDPDIQAGLAELSKKQNIQLNSETNSNQADLNILLTSLQHQQATNANSKVPTEPLTNNHLKNASILASKSSRSNSIDQLIAAAAVTAHGSTCMSPLSPSNSPTGSSHRANESAGQSSEEAANELTVSRKNLNTIVEAIFHVEGASRLDELVDHNEIVNQQQKYHNSLPSSSYTASSSGMSTPSKDEVQQQQKPPKKRKYTTEDITQTQEDTNQQQGGSTPAKQSNQFISEYYNSSGSLLKGEQCQSINKILTQTDQANSKTPKKSSSVSGRSSGNGSGSSSDENIEQQKKSSSNLVGLLITS